MTRNGIERRRLLKLAGGALAASAAGGLAGCSGLNPLGGGGGGSIDHSQWLYEPREGPPSYLYVEPARVSEFEDQLGSQWSSFEKFFGFTLQHVTDVDFDELDAMLTVSSTAVAKAGFDEDDVTDELEDSGFEESGDESGYTIYTRSRQAGKEANADASPRDRFFLEAAYAVGIKGNTMVGTGRSDGDDPEEVLETAIATKNGEEDRALRENEDLATLDDAVPLDHLASVSVQEQPIDEENANPDEGAFEGRLGSGGAWTFGADESRITNAMLFEEADRIDTDEIRAYLEEENENYEIVDVGKSGRVATVEATVATDDLFTTTETTTETGTTAAADLAEAPGR